MSLLCCEQKEGIPFISPTLPPNWAYPYSHSQCKRHCKHGHTLVNCVQTLIFRLFFRFPEAGFTYKQCGTLHVIRTGIALPSYSKHMICPCGDLSYSFIWLKCHQILSQKKGGGAAGPFFPPTLESDRLGVHILIMSIALHFANYLEMS